MMIIGLRKRGKGAGGLVGFGGGRHREDDDDDDDGSEEENDLLALLTVAADSCILTRCLAGGRDYRTSCPSPLSYTRLDAFRYEF